MIRDLTSNGNHTPQQQEVKREYMNLPSFRSFDEKSGYHRRNSSSAINGGTGNGLGFPSLLSTDHPSKMVANSTPSSWPDLAIPLGSSENENTQRYNNVDAIHSNYSHLPQSAPATSSTQVAPIGGTSIRMSDMAQEEHLYRNFVPVGTDQKGSRSEPEVARPMSAHPFEKSQPLYNASIYSAPLDLQAKDKNYFQPPNSAQIVSQMSQQQQQQSQRAEMMPKQNRYDQYNAMKPAVAGTYSQLLDGVRDSELYETKQVASAVSAQNDTMSRRRLSVGPQDLHMLWPGQDGSPYKTVLQQPASPEKSVGKVERINGTATDKVEVSTAKSARQAPNGGSRVRLKPKVINDAAFKQLEGLPSKSLGSFNYKPLFKLPHLEENLNATLQVRISNGWIRDRTNARIQKREIWGTDIYTDDSDIVAMLIHADKIPFNMRFRTARESRSLKRAMPDKANIADQWTSNDDLLVTLRVLPRLERYEGTYCNGIKSRSFDGAHDGASIYIDKIEPVPSKQNVSIHGRNNMKRRISDRFAVEAANHLGQSFTPEWNDSNRLRPVNS